MRMTAGISIKAGIHSMSHLPAKVIYYGLEWCSIVRPERSIMFILMYQGTEMHFMYHYNCDIKTEFK